MKKAMVLMGLVLAAAVVLPSAAPAKQADIPVAPALSTDIPVGPGYAYMARGITGEPTDPALDQELTTPTAEVAYMARGIAGEEQGIGQGLELLNLGREKKAGIIVIG